MIKLQDVADKASVSLSTASLILNGKGKFTDEVRQKVLAVAGELGYQKNVFASSIASRKISHIGILIHEDYEKAFEWNFIRDIIINLESVITEEGFFPIIIPVSSRQATQEILEKVLSSGSGALLSIHFVRRELFRQLEDRGVPIVVVNNPSLQEEFSTVCVDDYQGAYRGTSYLIEHGHDRIDFIDYHRPDQQAIVHDRFIGYRKALEEAEIDPSGRSRLTVNIDDMAEMRTLLRPLLESEHRPTAFFAHDDYFAARIWVVLRDSGIRVPEDVSLIAAGDTLDYNQPYIPPITTLSIETGLMGHLAGELMLKRIRGLVGATTVLKVSERIVERGTCRQIG